MSFRSLVCTGAGVVAIILLLFSLPHQSYDPKGIILSNQQVRAPISPSRVFMYQQLPAESYQTLGEIRVEQRFQAANVESQQRLLQQVKKMAASIGANAVIVKFFSSDEGVRKVYTFVGVAIYLPHAS